MAGTLTEASKENYHDLTSKGTVLVDFWGPSCQPCFALMPHVEKLAESRDDLEVIKLEAPKARRVCIELKVMTLPTFILYNDGEEVARLSDPELGSEKLLSWVDESLNKIGKAKTDEANVDNGGDGNA